MNEWVCFALLINEQNKIVLVQDEDKPKPNLWKMPGGKKQKWEEYYSQTITRELNEELPYSRASIATAKPLKKMPKEKPIPHMFIVFKGTYNFPVKPGGELKKAEEFTKDEVMDLIQSEKLLAGHSEVLREILSEKI
jgi:ADP-ribose pyrophosphatase YjhB (NUDIX family)